MKLIRRPNIEMYEGIIVTKDTELEYKTEDVEQSIKDLVFKSKTTIRGNGFTSVYDTVIELQEGDVILFADENRGYIKPVEAFVTVDEAIQDLECIRSLGEENVQD